MKRVFWTEQAEPIETSFARVLYDIRREDPDDLLMDSVTAYDIACDYDGLMALDALVVPFKTLERQMNVMRRVMNRVGTEIRVKEDDGEEKGIEISDVFKRNGTANIAVTFMLTDGQTISVIFHNPDMTPNKIDPTDELISWKWMINKKDVTIVVAPEQGKDLKVQEVARRIMKLANKNSAAFQRANAKRAERMKNIENQKTEIAQLEAELAKAQRDLETAKIEYEDADYRRVNARKTMTANTSSRDSLQTEKAAKEKSMADEAAQKAQEEARLAEERAAKEAAQAKPAMDPEDIIDRLPPAVKKLVKGNTIMEMGSDRMLIDHAAMMASAGIIEWEDDDAFTIKTIYKDGIPMTEQEKDVWIGQFRESYLDLKDGTLHYKDGREFKPEDVTSVLDKKASENQLLKEMNIIPDPDNEEILEGTMTRYDSERGDPRAVQMIKEILKTKGAKPKWAVVKATDDFNEYSTWSVTTPIIDFKEDPIEIGVHFEGGSWEYSVTVGKSPNGNASIHWYSNNYDPMVRKKGSWSGSVPTELFDKLAAIIGLKRVSETSISVQKKPVEAQQVAQPTPAPADTQQNQEDVIKPNVSPHTKQVLFTKPIIKAIQKTPIYSQDKLGFKAKVIAKFFLGDYTGYLLEGNVKTGELYMYTVKGSEGEFGYSTYEQISNLTSESKFGGARITFGVERDKFVPPLKFTLEELLKKDGFELPAYAMKNEKPEADMPAAEPAQEQPKQTVSGLKPMNLYDPEADENAEAGITSEVAPEEVVSADNGEWLKDQQVLQSIINGTHPNLLDDSVADFFEQMFPKYGEDEEKSAVVNAAMEAWTKAMLSSVNGLK